MVLFEHRGIKEFSLKYQKVDPFFQEHQRKRKDLHALLWHLVAQGHWSAAARTAVCVRRIYGTYIIKYLGLPAILHPMISIRHLKSHRKINKSHYLDHFTPNATQKTEELCPTNKVNKKEEPQRWSSQINIKYLDQGKKLSILLCMNVNAIHCLMSSLPNS